MKNSSYFESPLMTIMPCDYYRKGNANSTSWSCDLPFFMSRLKDPFFQLHGKIVVVFYYYYKMYFLKFFKGKCAFFIIWVINYGEIFSRIHEKVLKMKRKDSKICEKSSTGNEASTKGSVTSSMGRENSIKKIK